MEILGENLKMDVSLISPTNNFKLKEFSYNPDEINNFSMSRVIGLGLSLIKDNEIKDESLNNGFIVKSFSFDKNIDKETKNINLEKNKTKEKLESKTKVEEKKKGSSPLPNIKKVKENIQINKKDLLDNAEKLNKKTDKKETKSFKIDKSFLKND